MYLINTLNFAKAVLLANFFNRKTPVNVMWRITNRCNSKCKYCNIPLRKQKEPTTEQILNLIDQMKQAGTQRIGFVGGEPLVREDIGKIMDYCHEKQIYTTLVSNGYLVPQKIDLIRRVGYLVVSFDGPKEVHDNNREKGSYEKALSALKIAPKFVHVMSHTVITRNNLDCVDFILNLGLRYNFQTFFNLIQHEEKFMPTKKNYQKTIKKLINRKKQGFPVVNTLSSLRYLLSWEDFKQPTIKEVKREYPKCWGGKLFCDIDTDGTISPCCYTEGKDTLNVYKYGFDKAFQTMKEPHCKSCATFTNLIEYNFVCSLNLSTIFEWMKVVNFKKNDRYQEKI